jgi:hypothetical protein
MLHHMLYNSFEDYPYNKLYQFLNDLHKKVDSDKIAFGKIDSDRIFQSCMLDFDQILIDKCCVIPFCSSDIFEYLKLINLSVKSSHL